MAVGDAFSRDCARRRAHGDCRRSRSSAFAASILGAFTIINAMSRRNADPQGSSRPFDQDRDGFVMAEGGGMLVLEREEDAIARGARIYGEIAGFGQTCDAHHMSAPRPDGSLRGASDDSSAR